MRLEAKEEALFLSVKVVPNAGRGGIAGVLGQSLKVKVAQPPEDGRANRAVEALLAEVLCIPRSNVSVVAGHTRPQKTVRITGIALAAAREKLTPTRSNRPASSG